MTPEQFEHEKTYLITLSIVKSMIQKELITEAEYVKIDTILLEKYRPILGSLCRRNA